LIYKLALIPLPYRPSWVDNFGIPIRKEVSEEYYWGAGFKLYQYQYVGWGETFFYP
jgi:hypothetical protein